MLKQIELWDLYNKNIYVKIEKQIIKQFYLQKIQATVHSLSIGILRAAP